MHPHHRSYQYLVCTDLCQYCAKHEEEAGDEAELYLHVFVEVSVWWGCKQKLKVALSLLVGCFLPFCVINISPFIFNIYIFCLDRKAKMTFWSLEFEGDVVYF